MDDVAFGLICFFGWGTADYFIAKASRKTGGVLTLFWAQFIALIILLVFQGARGNLGDLLHLGGFGAYGWLALAGLLRTLGMVLFYVGMESCPAGMMTALSCSYPVVVVLVGVVFYQEVLSTTATLGVTLVLAGVLLLIMDQRNWKGWRRNPSSGLRSAAFALPAALFWGAALSILSYAVRQVDGILAVTGEQVSMVFCCGIWLLALPRLPSEAKKSKPWVTLAVIGILETVPLLSISLAARRGSAVIVAAISAAYPILTAVLAYAFFRERLSRFQMAAAVFVVAGVIVLGLQS